MSRTVCSTQEALRRYLQSEGINKHNRGNRSSQGLCENLTEEEVTGLRSEGKAGAHVAERGQSWDKNASSLVVHSLALFVNTTPAPVRYLTLCRHFLNEMSE